MVAPVLAGVLFVAIITGCGAHAFATAPAFRFTVTTDEAVNIDTTNGTPSISIDVGGQPRTAVYASGSGTSSLTFTYTATPGDLDLDGITVSSPIAKNGGTITDLAGNPIADADLAFTPPVTTGVKVSYPSLAMDFVNNRYSYNGTVYNSFDSFKTAANATFTNGTNGTYFDSSGTLRKSSTSNTPRFDYDPVTHVAKGLLMEDSSQNLALFSENFTTTYWLKTGTPTIAPNAADGPRGAGTMTKFSRTTTASSWLGGGSLGGSASTTYTATLFAKKGELNYVSIRAQSTYPNRADGTFDLANGTYTTNMVAYTNVSASITPVGNDVYRCSLTFTTDSGGGLSAMYISAVNGASERIDSTSTASAGGVYIDGAQVELGPRATSYITTSGSAVTRATESFTIPSSGGWYDQNKGTASSDQSYAATVTSSGAWTYLWRFDDGTANNRWNLFYTRQASALTFSGWIGGTNVYGSTAIAASAAQSVKAAAAQKLNDTRASFNGALQTHTTTWPAPPVNQLSFNILSPANAPASKWTKTFRYYPERVSDAQLQLLTQ